MELTTLLASILGPSGLVAGSMYLWNRQLVKDNSKLLDMVQKNTDPLIMKQMETDTELLNTSLKQLITNDQRHIENEKNLIEILGGMKTLLGTLVSKKITP